MPDVDLCPLHTTYTHSYTVNGCLDNKSSEGRNPLPGSCSGAGGACREEAGGGWKRHTVSSNWLLLLCY